MPSQITTADNLDKALDKVLKQYANDVTMTVKDLSKKFAKEGAKAVGQAASATFGGGKYARSWTSLYEEGRLSAQGVIYSKVPGLPHLLEKGHAKRGGGRVSGRVHIQPVEEELAEAFERAVKDDIQRSV